MDLVPQSAKTSNTFEFHLQLARAALKEGRAFFAYAELKTALKLGAVVESSDALLCAILDSPPSCDELSHNQYYRFHTLATELRIRAAGRKIAVLDVGGGEGQLASFVPEFQYCLVEPITNGISAFDLPFDDASFDFVVACHVLEHIPVGEREQFIDQLMTKSREGLILLNPFQIAGVDDVEQARFIFELTGAQWALEHVECGLPQIEDMYKYANDRGLTVSAKPNGSLATTTSVVLMDFIALRSGATDDWKKINRFLNAEFRRGLDSNDLPTAFLVTFTREPLSESANDLAPVRRPSRLLDLHARMSNLTDDISRCKLRLEQKLAEHAKLSHMAHEDLIRAEAQLEFLKDFLLNNGSVSRIL